MNKRHFEEIHHTVSCSFNCSANSEAEVYDIQEAGAREGVLCRGCCGGGGGGWVVNFCV